MFTATCCVTDKRKTVKDQMEKERKAENKGFNMDNFHCQEAGNSHRCYWDTVTIVHPHKHTKVTH